MQILRPRVPGGLSLSSKFDGDSVVGQVTEWLLRKLRFLLLPGSSSLL